MTGLTPKRVIGERASRTDEITSINIPLYYPKNEPVIGRI